MRMRWAVLVLFRCSYLTPMMVLQSDLASQWSKLTQFVVCHGEFLVARHG